MSERPVYTPAVAEFCGVRPSTVVAWRRRGTGPRYSRVGNRVLYFLSDVEKWLRDRQQDPAEAVAPAPEPIPEPKPKKGFAW
jgi:predicted DNA-binding transcriptional regulator AlpA